MQDGYSTMEQIVALARNMWIHEDMRSLCAHFMGHAALMRGENIRSADFSDLFVLPIQEESQNAMCLMLLFGKEKPINFQEKNTLA